MSVIVLPETDFHMEIFYGIEHITGLWKFYFSWTFQSPDGSFIRFHHLECLWQIQIWIICCKIQTCGLSFFICICVILPSSLKASLISLTLSLSLALFAIRRCLSRSSRSWGVKWLKSSSFSFFAKPEGSFSAAEI